MIARSFGRQDRGASWRSTSCLCICHYVVGPCDDAVCAITSTGAAVPATVVSQPHAAAVASSHRTPSTPFATPLGVTSRFSR